MTLDIQPLDPHHATEETLDGYHLMRAAAWAVDFPEDPPLTREGAIGRLRTPPVHEGPGRVWAGHLDGRPAGTVRLSLPEAPNDGIANVEVCVHPELRRRGIGTALLRSVLPEVLESGREAKVRARCRMRAAGGRRGRPCRVRSGCRRRRW
ncbi:GNAT family N-acetyltransferase [Kitasatospora paranensis]|uniref:GNAT family N-acetyltransferase n=1 Tax=Kitasatospora paranensis TaxID=258053 RepID=A0ABW2FVT2_9ACTN